MAGSVPSRVAPKPTARMASLALASRPPSRTVGVPMGFHGLRRSSRSCSARLVSASGSPSRSFVVKALSESHLPLVGNKAPDFEAEAVFDEEFIKVLRDLREVTSGLIFAEQYRKGEARLRKCKLSSRLDRKGASRLRQFQLRS